MDKFTKVITQKIERFNSKQLALFNYANCEKVKPIFLLFFQNELWGNRELLDDALIIQSQFIQEIPLADSDLMSLINDMELNAPELDNFETGLASYALDSVAIFIESLLFLKTEDKTHAINVSSLLRDLVDMFVQEKNNFDPNDNQFEKKIQDDYFMKKENERQLKLFEIISLDSQIDFDYINHVRNINSEFGEIIDFGELTNLYL